MKGSSTEFPLNFHALCLSQVFDLMDRDRGGALGVEEIKQLMEVRPRRDLVVEEIKQPIIMEVGVTSRTQPTLPTCGPPVDSDAGHEGPR